MSLANPALQPAKLIDEDYEIRSHEKHKAAEDCLTQLEVGEGEETQLEVGEEEEDEEEEEEGGGGEGEDEEEEEEEGGGEGEGEEEEEFVMCDICLKENEHWTFECPYLERIPNPKEATLGKGYDIVCTHCNVLGGHSDRKWVGRAIIKFCGICDQMLHWSAECPKKDLPPKKKSLLECSAEYEAWLAIKKSQAV